MDRSRLGFAAKVLLAFALALVAGAFLAREFEASEKSQRQRAAVEIAGIRGHLLQERVDRALSATYALAAVLRQGRGELDRFQELAEEMLRIYGGISSLQLAPGGVVSRIVPLAGNEAAIGHDLLNDPQRRKEALAAIASRKLTLAGPFKLRQGGVAVVGRLPVFVDDGRGGERFWGFSIALIGIAGLLDAADLKPGAIGDYDFELSRIHPDNGQRDVFARSADKPLDAPVSHVIEVANGEWTLSIAPHSGWGSPPQLLAIEMAMVLLFGVLTALFTVNVLKQPYDLRREVERRTGELQASNARLEAEIGERRHAEDALRAAHDELERRVAERTSALTQEIVERTRVEAALQAEKTVQQELIGKLETAQGQLLQADKMAAIGQLAAGIAHEINNPVGFIQSNLGTLRQYAEDLLRLAAVYEEYAAPLLANHPEVLSRVDAVRRSVDVGFLRSDLPNLLDETQDGVQRVRKIVRDLKDFSHVDEAVWQYADLHRGLDSTLTMVWNEIKYKAEVVREYGEIPQVECIASQVNQVFMNLLVNAAQAIDKKGLITLRTGEDEGMVWIEVADTGKGIPPENLSRIFEPFFTTKPVGKGTGLGLSLAYGIIKKHGGSIEVASETGRGTTFRVRLPVARPVDGAAKLASGEAADRR